MVDHSRKGKITRQDPQLQLVQTPSACSSYRRRKNVARGASDVYSLWSYCRDGKSLAKVSTCTSRPALFVGGQVSGQSLDALFGVVNDREQSITLAHVDPDGLSDFVVTIILGHLVTQNLE